MNLSLKLILHNLYHNFDFDFFIYFVCENRECKCVMLRDMCDFEV